MNQPEDKRCEKCGAGITAKHIIQRKAGLVQGVLLCPSCVEMKRRVALQARAAANQDSAAPPAAQPVTTAAPAPAKDEEDEVISLVSDDEMPTSKSQMIRSFAEGSTLGGAHHEDKLKRPIGGPRDAATRVRTFHCKLTDAGLANMDDLVNEWLDSHPDIYVKTVTSSIGVFESKTKEPHMFVAIFY